MFYLGLFCLPPGQDEPTMQGLLAAFQLHALYILFTKFQALNNRVFGSRVQGVGSRVSGFATVAPGEDHPNGDVS